MNAKIKIFSGNAHHALAKNICEHLGIELGRALVNSFPNGETFVQIQENVRGADVFLVQSIANPVNHNLMELLVMIDAARRASASRITAVIPFYAYARQDRKDKPRVPITSKLVANLLVAAGANRILTMDLHAQQIVGFFDIPVDHLYASPVFFEYLKQSHPQASWAVFSPDLGGVKRAIAYADFLECSVGIIAKRRKNAYEVEVLNIIGEAKNKHVILVDDISDTGTTLITATQLLKQASAKRVIAVITHPVTRPDVFNKIAQSGLDEFITTDTLPVQSQQLGKFSFTVLSISKLFAEAIIRIHTDQSINELFPSKTLTRFQ
ncbi:MAG: ribose-phosphate pyrophosphokinase [Puniceicoccales bacterium]|jgi:ribose-phosphate pyrophosphokinase|nr:ribose-phosphate pyrophosphokinase [Puniceicoccales bacterium]